jgi:hypothetical protein
MAKPICVIKLDLQHKPFLDLAEIQELLEARFTDYHVLVVPFAQPEDEHYEPYQVQVFYEKDFDEVKYEELKKIVSDAVLSKKN